MNAFVNFLHDLILQQQQTFYGSLSGTTWVSWYQKKHSPTYTYPDHQPSASSIYYDPWHPRCSIYVLDSVFQQSLSKFSLVYLLAWHPPLHTPYISSLKWLTSFRSTCLYHRNLFCCSIKIVSSIPSLSLNSTWNSILIWMSLCSSKKQTF